MNEMKSRKKHEGKHEKGSLLQIAPTIANIFSIPLSRVEAEPFHEILRMISTEPKEPTASKATESINGSVHAKIRVVLIVIDSFDCFVFKKFASEMKRICKIADKGIIIACETVSRHTTPAIASILTGLTPKSHKILTNDDVGRSDVDSILEILDANHVKTAAILEAKGTEPLKGKLSFVFPVEDREDILSYDEEIKEGVMSALRSDARMIFAHLRAIDRFAHRGWNLRDAVRFTDAVVGEIVDAIANTKSKCGRTLLLLCGDHEAHVKSMHAEVARMERGKVPLIASIVP